MVLNAPPVPMQKMNGAVRGFPTPQAVPPSAASSSPTAMLARNQPLNYGYPKPPQYFPSSGSNFKYLAQNENSAFMSSNKALLDFSKMPYGRFQNNNLYNKADPMMINYMENMKYGPGSSSYCLSPGQGIGTDEIVPTGISELERVFGSVDRCNQVADKVPSGDGQVNEDECSTESSDIDCEHLDET